MSEEVSGGTGNISADPLFVSGSLGNYYLSQVPAGNSRNSPCVDSGSNIAEYLGMDGLTTRIDNTSDSGIVDMGYHYPFIFMIISFQSDGNCTVLRWSNRAGKSYIIEWSEDMSYGSSSRRQVGEWRIQMQWIYEEVFIG